MRAYNSDNGLMARSELGEDVYLEYTGNPQEIRFEITPLTLYQGNYWPWSDPDCGICGATQTSWTTNGGTVTYPNPPDAVNFIYRIQYTGPSCNDVSVNLSSWQCNNGYTFFLSGDTARMDVYVVRVNITSASVVSDQINVELQPSCLSGNLGVYLSGPVGTSDHLLDQANKSGGQTHVMHFHAENIPERRFEDIVADWTIGSRFFRGSYEYPIYALGQCHNTQYGIPSDSICGDVTGELFYVQGDCNDDSNCTWQSLIAHTKWIAWSETNGTGYKDDDYYWYNTSYCSGKAEIGDATKKTKLDDDETCQYCRPDGQLISGQTVAYWNQMPQHGNRVQCMDRLFFCGTSVVKTATDRGAGQGTDDERQHWFDHYRGIIGCESRIDWQPSYCRVINIYNHN